MFTKDFSLRKPCGRHKIAKNTFVYHPSPLYSEMITFLFSELNTEPILPWIWKRDYTKEYLHCIFSVATLELTVSIVLLATHRYWCPLSVLVTLVIVNCLFWNDKLILGLAAAFRGDPSMVHEKFGSGFPLALQDKVAFCPSSTVRFSGWEVNSGLSAFSN